MARAAKKETPLTTEEKLAKALVPEVEQPYPVPENWCWVYGNALLRPMETKRPSGTIFKYIDIDSIDNKRQAVIRPKNIETEKAPSRASRGLHNGDTIFSMVRPYLKNIAFIDKSIADSIASTGFYVCSPRENVYPRYLYYMMISPYVVDGLNTFMKGDNSPSIRKEELERFPYPLPPLPEQQRIVALIESFFTDLDAAKEKLQAVLDGLSERKATILHQAFTGELTREWREKIGIGLDSWKDTILKEILDVRDGTHDSPQYHETGFPLITSKNLKNGKILEENLKFISKEDYDRINERSKVDSGDILFAMIGTIGNPTVIEKNPDFAIKNVALFKNINKVNVFFVKYYLESKRVVDKMTRESKGSTQRFVSLGYLRNFPIKTPTIEEQKEIVRILDDIFAKESQSKAAVESALAKIDTMKKAILATAFRGGFGTNDNSDESAGELLRKVL